MQCCNESQGSQAQGRHHRRSARCDGAGGCGSSGQLIEGWREENGGRTGKEQFRGNVCENLERNTMRDTRAHRNTHTHKHTCKHTHTWERLEQETMVCGGTRTHSYSRARAHTQTHSLLTELQCKLSASQSSVASPLLYPARVISFSPDR